MPATVTHVFVDGTIIRAAEVNQNFTDLINQLPDKAEVENITGSWTLNDVAKGLFRDGTIGAPSISFKDDTDTGFHRISTGKIGFSSDGFQKATLDSFSLNFGPSNNLSSTDDTIFRLCTGDLTTNLAVFTQNSIGDGKLSITSTGDIQLVSGGAGSITIGVGVSMSGALSSNTSLTAPIVNVSNYEEFPEVSEPAAPGVNTARLFARDNGSGKTQICAKFNTGAVQVLATQP